MNYIISLFEKFLGSLSCPEIIYPNLPASLISTASAAVATASISAASTTWAPVTTSTSLTSTVSTRAGAVLAIVLVGLFCGPAFQYRLP